MHAENTVVLLSKKLTLKEDSPVKQIICHSRKTESAIRISRSGSKTARPSMTILKLSGCSRRARAGHPVRRGFPDRSAAPAFNGSARPKRVMTGESVGVSGGAKLDARRRGYRRNAAA